MTETEHGTYTNPDPEGGPVEVTRRRFLTMLFALGSAIGVTGFFAPVIRYAYPVLKGGGFEKVRVASKAQLAPLNEGVRFEYQEIPAQLIQLEDGSYAAYSLVCTHLGCIVRWEPKNKDFHCPCHGGKFDPEGNVIAGPPPKPLNKLKLSVAGNDIFVEGIA